MNYLSFIKYLFVDQFTLYCFGGGGGGGDGGAAARKAAEEARVAAASKKINNIFNAAGRDVLYSKIRDDANKKALIDLNKERDITQRSIGFDIARHGLSGGSQDIDANRQLTDTYQQGVLKAANMASSMSNNARTADDNTKNNLINSIRAGLDQGNAISQAYTGMANNANKATANAQALSLSGFFDRLNQANQQRLYNSGLIAGQQQVVPGTIAAGTTSATPSQGSGLKY